MRWRRGGSSPPVADDRTAEPGPWIALSNEPYRVLFVSAAIVIFGVMGQAVARGWLARELTGSNAGLGGVMMAFGVAMLVATPVGGVTADRYDKRSVMFVSVAVLMATSALLGIAVVTDVAAYWMLLAASALQAGAFAFYLPARIAFISEVIRGDDLKNAIVLAQMSTETVRVLAPALAGILVGVSWFGVGGVFLAAGVAAAVAGAMLLRLPRALPRDRSHATPLAELLDAVHFVRRTPDVSLVGLLTIGVVMVGFPYLTFLPTLADGRFEAGATGYGIMSGVAGLGAFCAGTVDAFKNRGRRPRLLILCAGVSLGLALILLGLAPSYPLALVVLFLIGGTALVFQTSAQTLMLRLSPLEYHGRLQSMVILGFSGFGLAALPLGLLADSTSLGTTLVAMGVVIIGLNGWFAIVRHRHRRRRGVEFA